MNLLLVGRYSNVWEHVSKHWPSVFNPETYYSTRGWDTLHQKGNWNVMYALSGTFDFTHHSKQRNEVRVQSVIKNFPIRTIYAPEGSLPNHISRVVFYESDNVTYNHVLSQMGLDHLIWKE